MSNNTTIIMNTNTLMPTFVKKLTNTNTGGYICSCKKCKDSGKKTPFTIMDDLQKHLRPMKAHLFKCPEEGCDVHLWTMSSMITNHIKNDHHELKEKFMNNGHETAIYCKDCKKYTSFHKDVDRTAHFKEHSDALNLSRETKEKISVVQSRKAPPKPNEKSIVNSVIKKIEAMSFDTKELFSKNDLLPLIKNDKISRMEKDCKYGNKCTGFSNGVCAFNHHGNTEMNDESTTFCEFERTKEKQRCTKLKCSFDHLSGRVTFVMKKKNAHSDNFLPDEKTEATDSIVVDVAETLAVETTDSVVVEVADTPTFEATETRVFTSV